MNNLSTYLLLRRDCIVDISSAIIYITIVQDLFEFGQGARSFAADNSKIFWTIVV